MLQKLIAFIMAIISFFASLFGINLKAYEFEDMRYGEQERQVLDLYLPKDNSGEAGLILMIHGGAWIGGDKESYTDTAKSAAESYGYAAASMNYRYVSPDVTVFDILDDIDAALAAIKSKAAENGVEISRVMLMGYSAGAHLSLLYSYSRADTAPIAPVAAVSYAGPTNLTDTRFYYDSALGSVDDITALMSMACGVSFTMDTVDAALPALSKASPITYAESAVPTLLMHGMKDSIVPYSNAVALDEALTAANVKHTLITFPNSDHDLAADSDMSEEAFRQLLGYAQAYIG